MKRFLCLSLLVLLAGLSFSLSLGIKGQFVNTGFKKYDKGIRITTVYNNAIARKFLKPGDILLGMSHGQVLGAFYDESTGKLVEDTGDSFSSGFNVERHYISDVEESMCLNFSSINELNELLAMIDEEGSGLIVHFLIYRNNRFVEFTLK